MGQNYENTFSVRFEAPHTTIEPLGSRSSSSAAGCGAFIRSGCSIDPRHCSPRARQLSKRQRQRLQIFPTEMFFVRCFSDSMVIVV